MDQYGGMAVDLWLASRQHTNTYRGTRGLLGRHRCKILGVCLTRWGEGGGVGKREEGGRTWLDGGGGRKIDGGGGRKIDGGGGRKGAGR